MILQVLINSLLCAQPYAKRWAGDGVRWSQYKLNMIPFFFFVDLITSYALVQEMSTQGQKMLETT